MRIEDEIKVKKFHNEWHKATINILFTGNWINGILEKRAGAQQITIQQFNVLRILRGQYPNPATNRMVKERMIDKMPDVSRIMDRLVAKGLVSRSQNPDDRRAVDVVITDKGIEVLAELDESMLLLDVLEKNITKEECHVLNDLLEKIRGHERL